MDKYALGKDMQLILSKLEAIESRLQQQTQPAEPKTPNTKTITFTRDADRSTTEYLVFTSPGFNTEPFFRFNSAVLEIYPSGQWNFISSCTNGHSYNRVYADISFTFNSTMGPSIWSTTQHIWLGHVGILETRPFSVPQWNGNFQRSEHYDELTTVPAYLNGTSFVV